MKTATKSILSAIIIIILSAFTAAAQTSKVCSGTTQITENEKRLILESHNKARDEFKSSSLIWDCELAKTAQEWASGGIFGHRPDNDFGENLFVTSGANSSPVLAVRQWMLEKSFWNNGSGTCQTGKICTHYTQIVWGKTTKSDAELTVTSAENGRHSLSATTILPEILKDRLTDLNFTD